MKKEKGLKYQNRLEAHKSLENRKAATKVTYRVDPTEEVFDTQ